MNPAFVYRRNGRSIFWLAFFFALAIHLGAVALAKTKSPSIKLQDVSPLSDVEVVDTAEPEPALLEESAKGETEATEKYATESAAFTACLVLLLFFGLL